MRSIRSALSSLLYLCSGWLLCWVLVVAPRDIALSSLLPNEDNNNNNNHDGPSKSSAWKVMTVSPPSPPSPPSSSSMKNHSVLHDILARRPNWRRDFELEAWLPKWRRNNVEQRTVMTQQHQYYNSTFPLSQQEEATHDDFFWNHIVVGNNGKNGNNSFAFANANIGLGHRLAQLSYSWTCQIVPHQQQQLIHWVTGGLDDNRGWHYLFQDSPVLAGVPRHWHKGKPSLEKIQAHREQHDESSSSSSSSSSSACQDYSTYFPLDCDETCKGFKHPRDLWFLRFAQEPSAQEFYQLLRAQTQPRIKERVARYMDHHWPSSKLVIGVHIRAGNGKDDGLGHFDLVQRGDWLAKDLPKAVTMIRQHIRMVASSVLDRYTTMGGGSYYKSNANDDNEAAIDNYYQVFLATDTEKVLAEFRKQDPSVLTLEQERPKDGVAIFQSATCQKGSNPVDCALETQENMLVDALLLSSADVLLAESFSNFLYSLPATLALAEGKIFCQAGRAALGGKYITQDDRQASLLGDPKWWASPPPNVMPVRCQTSAWAARDRFNFHNFPDVMARTGVV
ncbi:unnamed protein product [Cylindrotheca closterium]|uniref:GDP-fucose protein O-fucosyltransferase 1 n=1 Tax=Cylindrotheca closterium TaxID=2856 RepID=A0AAD2FSN4_9STRA|nr:unnamed protein product [Cylindrotheca closterium]